jgi:hypothetical protein
MATLNSVDQPVGNGIGLNLVCASAGPMVPEKHTTCLPG